MHSTTSVFLASLFSLVLSAPSGPITTPASLESRNLEQHTCKLIGVTQIAGGTVQLPIMSAPGKGTTNGGNGAATIRWGYELWTKEHNDRFWICYNQGKCNPRASGGQTLEKSFTSMNTDIKWEVFGEMNKECRCIVDGKTYPGTAASGKKSLYEGVEQCSCEFPCNTGFADKFVVTVTDKPSFQGKVSDIYLAPNFCYDLSPSSRDEYGNKISDWFRAVESIRINSSGRGGSCMFYTEYGCQGTKGGPIRHNDYSNKEHGDLAKVWNGNKIAAIKCFDEYCVDGDKRSGCEKS